MVEIRKRFHRGEKGFTLIELLVVVAILGVLAAVIVPNVSKFMGSGTVDAANTEAHNVMMAVVAYMADNGMSSITPGSVGPSNDLPAGSANTSPKDFLVYPEGLQATYAFDSDGDITGANASSSGEWAGYTYTVGSGWHE